LESCMNHSNMKLAEGESVHVTPEKFVRKRSHSGFGMDVELGLGIPKMNVPEDTMFSMPATEHCMPHCLQGLGKSKKLSSRTGGRATALFLKIEGLDLLRNPTCIQRLADTMSEIFEQVDNSAANHNIDVVDRRWDSFILMSFDKVQELATPAHSIVCDSARSHDDQQQDIFLPHPHQVDREADSIVGRMLALAIELHYRLHSSRTFHDNGLQLAMGIASGSTTLLGSGFGASWTARGALSMRGDAADLAQEMAGVCGAGAVAVHESALWRWAAAERCLPPASELVAVEGGERRRAGMFDLGTLAFRQPAPVGGMAGPRAAVPAGAALRRSASYV
jgi:hypothetical protein